MLKVMVRHRGVRRSVVLSSMARWGSIVAWSGTARSCPAWCRTVRCGFIKALRGLAWHGTVLSCPVRLCKALFSKPSLWFGGAVSSPAGSSGVRLCKVRCFMARSCFAGWATVERCFVWLGKAFRGVEWSGDVLFGAVGFSKARFYCGIVWKREALFCVVKFCPVKHCYVRHAKALLRRGIVGSGFARLRAVGQALVLSRSGVATQGGVRRAAAMLSAVRFSSALLRLGLAMRCPVRLGSVKRGFVMCCTPRLGVHGY
jgi:hypothetical protein